MKTKLTLAVIALIVFLFNPSELSAQKKFKFGTVSKEEMEMTDYAPDPNAGAVILYDIGRFRSSQSSFTRQMRVKILKKTGLDWANWEFDTPSKGQFRVFVYNMENGEIVKTKVKGDNIFNEEVFEGYDIYKVFAPNVKVGSIIDIEYTFPLLPFEWRFQERIPVAYSELQLESSSLVFWNVKKFGNHPLKSVGRNHWIAQDVPAFEVEPYLSDYSNFITKMEIQITQYGTGYSQYRLATKWSYVAGNVWASNSFGNVINTCGFLNEYAKVLNAMELSKEERIVKAFEYIKENIKWDGTKRIFASKSYISNFKKDHSGSVADINLMLIALLRKVGINANTVVLSTRDNGYISRLRPTLNKLNYVIALVEEGETKIPLDATSTHVAPGVLPLRCINGEGMIIRDETYGWYDLTSNQAHSVKQYITAQLAEDGTATAEIMNRQNGYSYLDWANERESVNDDDETYLSGLKDKYSNLSFDGYEVSKRDTDKLSVTEKLTVDFSDEIINTGNSILVNPVVMFPYNENPFKEETRQFPLDFGYNQDVSYTLKLQIPEGYEVAKVPESFQGQTPDKKAQFIYQVAVNNNVVQFNIKVSMLNPYFSSTEYIDLRYLFSLIVDKVNEPIELVAKG